MRAKQSAEGQRVPIAQGVRVPRSFEWSAPGEAGSPSLHLGLAVVDDRVVCTRLELRGSVESPVTASLLRLIRLDDMVTVASLQNASITVTAKQAATVLNAGPLPPDLVRNAERATRRRPADLPLEDVAKLYEQLGGGGDAMNEIREVAQCSEGTAWRLIRRARDAGLISPEPIRRGPKGKGK